MNENIKIVRNKSELEELLVWLSATSGPISYDIETTGLNVRKDKVIGFSVSDGTTGWYVVYLEWTGTELIEILPYHLVCSAIRLLQEKQLITWNGSFDTRFTYHYFKVGLIDNIYCDGMLLKHTVDENSLSYALKNTAEELFGGDSKQAQTDLMESVKSRGGETKGDMYKAESSIIATYGAQDALLTYKVYKYYQAELEKQNLTKFFYDDEVMPLYREVTIPMELHGIPVDVPFMQKSQNEISLEINNLEQSIQSKIAPYLTDFNQWYIDTKYPFKLTGRFKTALGAKIAHELWPKTDSGAVSLNKTDINKAQNYTATELKRGSQRPLLPKNTLFEQIVNQQIYCPPDLIRDVQLELLAEDGIKYPFNLKSKDHLKRLFFGYGKTKSVLNEKALSYTDKGAPQVDDEFIELISRKYDWANELHVFNKLNKIKSTYIDAYLDDQEDGIFYPSFFQHRTVSGRFGSNIQQLSRPLEEGSEDARVVEFTNRIRKFFNAPEGFIIVDADYESLEPHVFAHVSGDQGLKDIFLKGHDFYSTIAIKTEKLEGVSADKSAPNYLGKVDKSRRQKAKAYCLAVPYGMGPYALSMHLNCSEQEAKTLWNGYLNGFPQLKEWMASSNRFASTHGYIDTQSGRRRRFNDLPYLINRWGSEIFDPLETWKRYNDNPAMYNEAKQVHKTVKNYLNNAKNVQIQGLGASIVNRGAIEFSRQIKQQNVNARIIAQIHDQVIVLCEQKDVDVCKKILQDTLENTYKISIPLKAKPSTGKNWYESKD